MSTAGKVLSVCVMLVLIIWVCLLSVVARRNSNWGEKLKKQDESITKLDTEQEKALHDVANLKADVGLVQELTDKEVIVFRSEYSDFEGHLTHAIELLERLKNQVASQLAAEKSAEAAKTQRTAEKKETEKLLAAAQTEVEQLKQVHGELTGQLTKLENEFISLRAENAQLIKKASY